MKSAMLGVSDVDLRVWELCTAVPKLNLCWAYTCLFLNIFFPGIGTMIAACVGDKNVNKTQVLIGFT